MSNKTKFIELSRLHSGGYNVNLRKLLSAHKSHVRETSLFTGTNMGMKGRIEYDRKCP